MTMAPEVRYKMIESIQGLENYPDYAVDVNGNIWSFKFNKFRKLKAGWAKKKESYMIVRLSDRTGKITNFYIHRLVAMAYLPCEDFNYRIIHLNNDLSDNRIENLEWRPKKHTIHYKSERKELILDDFIANKLKQVHAASHRKGLPVPDSYEFMNSMIDGALEQYINQYGLRKILLQSDCL